MSPLRLLTSAFAGMALSLHASGDAPVTPPAAATSLELATEAKPGSGSAPAQAPEPKDKSAAKTPEPPPLPPPFIAAGDLPKEGVRVEILEFPGKSEESEVAQTSATGSAPAKKPAGMDATWSALPSLKTDEYVEPAFAISWLPNKYNERGVKVDRSPPFLVRAAAVVTFPEGGNRILMRSLTGARLSIDGQPVAMTPHLHAKYADLEQVPDMARLQLVPGLPLLPPGHKEALVTVEGDGKPHVIAVEIFVGGKTIRPEIGQFILAIGDGDSWQILDPSGKARPLTAPALATFSDEQRDRTERLNAARRYHPSEEAYWQMRHDLARKYAPPAPGIPQRSEPNPIDRFIAAKLDKAGATAAPLSDDAAFLRRVTLDTIGLLPTAGEAAAFLANTAPDKRARAIDRLLADSRWADRWMPYWQDVLAENPNMLKGTLNNTGPFRFWLRDALGDNLAMDRFATELLSMEGSSQYGGPAGFGVASQNDLPMAAKAQIVTSAFLAMQMKCARCHDAPYHPYDQADLLGLAAMLQRSAIKTPGSSLTQGLSVNSHVTVTLKPGEAVNPHWPFSDLPSEPLPGVLRESGDTREKLAALLTDPRNDRFPQVIVNRLWKELLGFGIVDPVDDWENARPSHPELLKWLGHELSTHGYDLKHVARFILNSETYQRIPTAEGSRQMKSKERLFSSPARRRMSAEQLVDTLFQAAGKPFNVETLTQDPEDRQSGKDHGNFGIPRRAWEFIALSNERDRPALAKPRAQTVTDVLAAFGWRESRTEPRSVREEDASVLQPALLANGPLGARITRLSDDSAFLALALKEQPVGDLVTQLFLRVLSRPPAADELALFEEILKPGYEERRTGAAPLPPVPPITKAVSWANHLNPEATRVVLEAEKQARAGDPPSPRLRPEWRERMEDALWALMLSPEFLHIP